MKTIEINEIDAEAIEELANNRVIDWHSARKGSEGDITHLKDNFLNNTEVDVMKKLLMLVVLGMVAVVGAEEVKFNKKVWEGLREKAEIQAEREIAKDTVFGWSRTNAWEAGKGVCYVDQLSDLHTFVKYDSDGRLVKVGAKTDFPEIARIGARKVELVRQMQEEYAKSLGVTVSEIYKVAGGGPLLRGRLTGRKMSSDEIKKMRQKAEERERKRQDELDKEDDRVNAELKKLREARQNADPK